MDEPPVDAEVMIVGAAADPAGAVWVDPHAAEPTRYGTAGRIDTVLADAAVGNEEEIYRALLTAAMDRLHDQGLGAAAITVDAQDRGLAGSCRLLGFVQDRIDTEYIVSPSGA